MFELFSKKTRPTTMCCKAGRKEINYVELFLLKCPPCSLTPATSTFCCIDELHVVCIELHNLEISRRVP